MNPPPRKSRTINLLLLGGSILAFSACVCGGCGRNRPASVRNYDPPWYDAQGKPIAKAWKTDENGKRVPVQTPYDANGKPIPLDANGNPVPPPGNTYSSTSGTHYRSSGLSWWPYIFTSRSGSSYSSGYRSGPSSSGSTYFGGSKPGSSSPSSGSSFGGSVSRGGFGGSASSAGS